MLAIVFAGMGYRSYKARKRLPKVITAAQYELRMRDLMTRPPSMIDSISGLPVPPIPEQHYGKNRKPEIANLQPLLDDMLTLELAAFVLTALSFVLTALLT